MKIFIDIGHPAHVHYFKHFIRQLKEEGHQFIVTARDKEMTHELLQKEGLEYISRGRGSDSLVGKLFYIFKADRQLLKIAKSENPDLFLSFASPYCAHTAWLMRKPCLTLDDTETATLNHWLYRPFSTKILTPQAFQKDFGKKHSRFPSFMELAYLHPNRFQPDPEIYEELGLAKGEKYVLIRFVSLHANHDLGVKGLSLEDKRNAVYEFSKYAKVFISSESELPEELRKHQLPTASHRIHHVIAFADLIYGESATMSSEAAVLGTPAVFVNKLASRLGTIHDQQTKWGLVYSFSASHHDFVNSVKKGREIVCSKRDVWKKKKKKLVQENADFVSYLSNEISTFLSEKREANRIN